MAYSRQSRFDKAVKVGAVINYSDIKKVATHVFDRRASLRLAMREGGQKLIQRDPQIKALKKSLYDSKTPKKNKCPVCAKIPNPQHMEVAHVGRPVSSMIDEILDTPGAVDQHIDVLLEWLRDIQMKSILIICCKACNAKFETA